MKLRLCVLILVGFFLAGCAAGVSKARPVGEHDGLMVWNGVELLEEINFSEVGVLTVLPKQKLIEVGDNRNWTFYKARYFYISGENSPYGFEGGLARKKIAPERYAVWVVNRTFGVENIQLVSRSIEIDQSKIRDIKMTDWEN